WPPEGKSLRPDTTPERCTASLNRHQTTGRAILSSSSTCARSPSTTRTGSSPARTTWSKRLVVGLRRRSKHLSTSTGQPSPEEAMAGSDARNHGLRGEILDEFDLLVGEPPGGRRRLHQSDCRP